MVDVIEAKRSGIFAVNWEGKVGPVNKKDEAISAWGRLIKSKVSLSDVPVEVTAMYIGGCIAEKERGITIEDGQAEGKDWLLLKQVHTPNS